MILLLAFFSDVHANLAALQAVLADIESQRADQSYCLGDLIGYGPDPNGVVDLIRAEDVPTIMGNYDDGVAFERGGCGCFYPDDEAKRIGALSYEFTSRTLTSERKAWLRELPIEIRVEVEGLQIHLVHGSPRRINEYLLPEREPRTFERIAAQETADILVFGHTHRAWHRNYENVLFINVGSVGRPTDGDPRASYTLLQIGPRGEREVREVRVGYDTERTASQILAAGLPAELAEQIRLGGRA